MGRSPPLFRDHEDWLAHTLALDDRPCPTSTLALPDGAQLRRLDTGVLRYWPPPGSGTSGLILSAGIHGNETAPIELLNALVTDLVQGQLQPRIPLLLILGNPPAMVAEKRFREHNLNRLFSGGWNDYADVYETRRASQLEGVCQAFARYCTEAGLPLRHYDLHTAIRPSQREKFALYPFVEGREVPREELDLLQRSGIGTVLLQHRRANTFSGFSSEHLGAESFTLELGKVRPFGQNQLSGLSRLRETLVHLMAEQPLAESGDADDPEIFQVVHEVIHTGPGFRFYVADDVANFTEFPPDTLIWNDAESGYRVGDQPEAVIFPNPNVPVGHRVALMIRKALPTDTSA